MFALLNQSSWLHCYIKRQDSCFVSFDGNGHTLKFTFVSAVPNVSVIKLFPWGKPHLSNCISETEERHIMSRNYLIMAIERSRLVWPYCNDVELSSNRSGGMYIQNIGNSCHNSFALWPLQQQYVGQEHSFLLPLAPDRSPAKWLSWHAHDWN